MDAQVKKEIIRNALIENKFVKLTLSSFSGNGVSFQSDTIDNVPRHYGTNGKFSNELKKNRVFSTDLSFLRIAETITFIRESHMLDPLDEPVISKKILFIPYSSIIHIEVFDRENISTYDKILHELNAIDEKAIQ